MKQCPECGSKWITKVYLEKEKTLKNICLTCNHTVYEGEVSDLDKEQFGRKDK